MHRQASGGSSGGGAIDIEVNSNTKISDIFQSRHGLMLARMAFLGNLLLYVIYIEEARGALRPA